MCIISRHCPFFHKYNLHTFTNPTQTLIFLYIDALRTICNDYHKRIRQVEESKYDIEYKVATKDLEASTTHTHTHTLAYTPIYAHRKPITSQFYMLSNHFSAHPSDPIQTPQNPTIQPVFSRLLVILKKLVKYLSVDL